MPLNGPLRSWSIGPWAREPVGEPEAETPPGGQASPTGVGAHGNTQRCNKAQPKQGPRPVDSLRRLANDRAEPQVTS